MRTSTHLIGLALTLVVVLGASASAQARTFNVVSCTASQPDPGPWAPDSTPWSRASAWCARTEGMFIWGDIANGPRLPYGSITRWKLTMPGALRNPATQRERPCGPGSRLVRRHRLQRRGRVALRRPAVLIHVRPLQLGALAPGPTSDVHTQKRARGEPGHGLESHA